MNYQAQNHRLAMLFVDIHGARTRQDVVNRIESAIDQNTDLFLDLGSTLWPDPPHRKHFKETLRFVRSLRKKAADDTVPDKEVWYLVDRLQEWSIKVARALESSPTA